MTGRIPRRGGSSSSSVNTATSGSTATSTTPAIVDRPSPSVSSDSGRRHDTIPEEAEGDNEGHEGGGAKTKTSKTTLLLSPDEDGKTRFADNSPIPLSSSGSDMPAPTDSIRVPASAISKSLPPPPPLRLTSLPTSDGKEEEGGKGVDGDGAYGDEPETFIRRPSDSVDPLEPQATPPLPGSPLAEPRRGSSDSSEGLGSPFPVEWIST
jgi:hypothetical protein